MKALPFMLAAVVSLLGIARADDLTLTDIQGRSIEVVIKSADETNVMAIRKSDRKEVTLPIASLNEASRAAVGEWLKRAGRVPTQDQHFELQSNKANELLTISFKLPAGKYNTDSTDAQRAKVLFDGGDITFILWESAKKPEEIASDLDRAIDQKLQRIPPSERAALEPTLKPTPLTVGEYRGCEVVQFMPDLYMCKLSGKDFHFEAWLRHKEGSPITPDDMKAILATVKIGGKKKPLAERR